MNLNSNQSIFPIHPPCMHASLVVVHSGGCWFSLAQHQPGSSSSSSWRVEYVSGGVENRHFACTRHHPIPCINNFSAVQNWGWLDEFVEWWMMNGGMRLSITISISHSPTINFLSCILFIHTKVMEIFTHMCNSWWVFFKVDGFFFGLCFFILSSTYYKFIILCIRRLLQRHNCTPYVLTLFNTFPSLKRRGSNKISG